MIKTEGIVLKEMKYKETSKILTIYTEKLGKISVMAKGANRPSSRLIANTQVFSYNEFQLVRGRSFYYLSQGDIIDSNYNIREDMQRLIYGFYILELLEKSVPDEEENKKLFQLLKRGLEVLREGDSKLLNIILAYELKFISFLGYKPYLSNCVLCNGTSGYRLKFSLENGGIICENCFSQDKFAHDIDVKTYDGMIQLLYSPLDEASKINIEAHVVKKIHKIILDYILYNIDRKDFNSLNLIKDFEN